MSKRKVSAALHRELSEYAALLRALRARDTMDVTRYLTKPSMFIPEGVMPTFEDTTSLPMEPSTPKGSQPSDSPYVSPSGNPSAPSESSDRKPTKEKHLPRDHWTRWPVMLHDILKPEWTLEDEVAVLASQVLKATSMPFAESSLEDDYSDEGSQDDELIVLDTEIDDDDPDPAFYVPSLTYMVANFLSEILAELASHTPPRVASMQNRIEPLKWRGVIDAVVSCGNPEFAKPELSIIQHVIRRMEATYGPTSSTTTLQFERDDRAIERTQKKVALTKRNRTLSEVGITEIFTQPPRPLKQRRT